MCIDLKRKIHTEFGKVKSIQQIQKSADLVIRHMGIESIDNGGVPIVDILRKMGFSVYKDDFKQQSLSAFIAIDPDLQEKFGTNKIICVNSRDNLGHKRFALAHELAHYLFDFDDMATVKYFNTYIADDEFCSEVFTEKRANMFAACLLMPENSFRKKEKELSKRVGKADVISDLSLFFGVSTQAVMRRFKELDIHGYE